ncbi:hypothetical protein ACTMU2_13905 [Cupriavidus basilensis]
MNKAIKKELEQLPEAARKGNRMGVSYQRFRLTPLQHPAAVQRLAIKVDDAGRGCGECTAGRPQARAGVVEQTFEALLKEGKQGNRDDSLDPESTEASMMAIGGDGTTIQRVTFRDVMRRVAGKLE